jgi:hypothetical protein
MLKALSCILVAMQYLPAVVQGVVAVQSVLKDAPGTTKKDVFMQVVDVAKAAGQQVPDAHVKIISDLVDGVKGSLKASGYFDQETTPILDTVKK